MPNREDETWLNIHPHPPNCNCTDCVQKRLLAAEDDYFSSFGYPVIECPACGCQSLFYNGKKAEYQCLNQQCNATGETLMEIRRTFEIKSE